jgi:O-antigen ligase
MTLTHIQPISQGRQALHQKIDQVLLVYIAFSFPFSIKANSIGIILLTLNWLVSGRLKTKLKTFAGNRLALLVVSVFPLYLLGLLYTADLREGTFMLEKSLSLLLLPLVISSSSFPRKAIEAAFVAFVAACLVATVVSYITVYANYLRHNDWYLTFIQGHFRDNYASFIGLHPTYFTLYLTFSMIILVHFLFAFHRSLSVATKGLLYFLLLYFLVTEILLSARMPLLALAVIGLGFSFFWLYRQKKIAWIAVVTVGAIGIAYQAFTHPILNKRFREVAETAWAPPTGDDFNSTNVRIGILRCGMEALQQAWLTGFGTGDTQHFLNQCYERKGYSPIMYENTLNLHNAYLQIWLTVGVAGLLWLVSVLAVPAIRSYRFQAYIFLAFLLLIGLSSLTESLLNAQKGVVFFSFFYSLFAFHYYPRVGEWGQHQPREPLAG